MGEGGGMQQRRDSTRAKSGKAQKESLWLLRTRLRACARASALVRVREKEVAISSWRQDSLYQGKWDIPEQTKSPFASVPASDTSRPSAALPPPSLCS
eukprot:6190063-Pleurochrysis_carterae.AAC.4